MRRLDPHRSRSTARSRTSTSPHLKTRFPADTLDFNGTDATRRAARPSTTARTSSRTAFVVTRDRDERPRRRTSSTGEDRRNLYPAPRPRHAAGLPEAAAGDGASSPALADLDGDNRNELVFGTSDGLVHAMRPDGSELPGWPVHGDALPLHPGGHALHVGEVTERLRRRDPRLARGRRPRPATARPRWSAADMRRQGLRLERGRHALRFQREANRALLRQAAHAVRQRRAGPAVPHAARLPRARPVLADLDGGRQARDRRRGDGPPRLRLATRDGAPRARLPGARGRPRRRSPSIDPATARGPTFKAAAGAELNQGAIVDTPAVGDIDGDGKPEIVVGTNEEYKAERRRRPQRGDSQHRVARRARRSRAQLTLGNTRLYAIKPTGDPGGPNVGGPSPYLPGWPVKLGIINTRAPAGRRRGRHRQSRDWPGDLRVRRRRPQGRRRGATPARRTSSTRTGPRATARRGARTTRWQTDFAAGIAKYDTPAIPAVGHPAFGDLGGASPPALPDARRPESCARSTSGSTSTRAVRTSWPRGRHRRVSSGRASRRRRQRSPVPHRTVGRRHRRAPRRRDHRRHRLARPRSRSTRRARPPRPVAEADAPTGRSPPADRLLRHARHRRLPRTRSIARSRVRAPCSRTATDAPACTPGVVAALPPRPRQLRRLSAATPTIPGRPEDLALSADSVDDELEGARRRPALRHRQPL